MHISYFIFHISCPQAEIVPDTESDLTTSVSKASEVFAFEDGDLAVDNAQAGEDFVPNTYYGRTYMHFHYIA